MSIRPILPARHPVHGTVRVPGSKSLTNRALVLGALAEGRTVVQAALFSDDTRLMAGGLRALGFSVEEEPQAGRFVVWGAGGRIPARCARVEAGNAGTVARFLTAVAALGSGHYVVDGSPRMRQRPILDLVVALGALGCDAVAPSGCPPVWIRARGLAGGRAAVRSQISSQFLSALLQVAPLAASPVELVVDGPLVAAPYVEMTLGVMAAFGVTVRREDPARYLVAPQRYAPRSFRVEPDASSASYFFAAAAATGGTVTVPGLGPASLQGDVHFLDVLQAMGCMVEWEEEAVTVRGPSRLHGVDADLANMPDMTMTLAALAPFADGAVRIRGVGHIRHQESDRLEALATELRRLGQEVRLLPDGLEVLPRPVRPAVVETYGDHRMAMAFAVVGLGAAGVAIAGPECVSKTFPEFFSALDALLAGER
ncbi:MAG: 3-phosphoshikimate 1-carboxyvinyltransferase [Armatimonadota bacterium]|nr:3-phosphoshikimate 1-carboxyvinyltransferase [Armatimonadota bacterium]MDR7427833.1 3-phosphoshikimate 1-carboxyvinyltransferase [Armatimonadota bacterium]MDR7463540.1 3-phosphoshikimate 1-carboxyvinyltransferase [Armatimonadota bacterium]MDR7470605.1 3-phosphoshikimate 1-carboxyvinyltransferase [Armatimonadota bacterium]MDR7473878.1 3-phosphoshikimate 1-carboxyvinyltransferase [Armatimonadota bacterium]